MSAAILSLYAVFADREEAERIGREMVEQGLAACVNILGPCHSIYRWQGAIESAEEVAAIFKTRRDAAPALISAIERLHSYDLPALAVWEVGETLPAYAAWVRESVAPPESR